MPWLHLIFDAWEDHRLNKERERQELAAAEAALREIPPHDDADEVDEEDEDKDKDKKKKRRKHKK